VSLGTPMAQARCWHAGLAPGNHGRLTIAGSWHGGSRLTVMF
jgi:hypothetical protein